MLVVKKYMLLWLLTAAVVATAQAQPMADTASAFGVLPQEEDLENISARLPKSATEELIELEQVGADLVELDADETEVGSQSVSGLLGASRDVFVSQVQYNLTPFRFNLRGYRSDYSSVYFNGFSFQDPETGYANYNVWGGLNDVLRNYTTVYGLAPSDQSFGNFAGTTTYNTRASNYRKQTSTSIAASNRTYATRLMASYSSGLMNNGWAVTASASARLAEEGFMDGTPYEGYSYFLAVEKQLNKRHALNLTIFGSPLKRGMMSAVTQDVWDMTDYHYNPNWGYQDGEKRSARIRNTHMPVAMLNYFWKISENAQLEAGAAVQTGRNGTSALDWFEGNDPRPDYYRKLPRYNLTDLTQTNNRNPNKELHDWAVQQWTSRNPKVTQIDWQALYEGNYAANNGVNRASAEWQAMNIVKEYRNDQTTISGYANYRNHINKYISAFGGVEAKAYKGSFFQTVLDPLGADYYLNMDKYVVGDPTVTEPLAFQSNTNESGNQLRKYKGDRFGYDYDIYQNDIDGWATAQLKFNKVDFFVTGMLDYTEFWRDGHMKNGRVDYLQNISRNDISGNMDTVYYGRNHSYGVSKKNDFITGGVKANVTYKITGRHFATLNGGMQTRAPQFRNSYIQIRYADFTLDDADKLISDSKYKGKIKLETEKIYTADAAYIFRGTALRFKAAAFYTLAKDLSEVRTFYDENTYHADGTEGALIEYITQGMDKQYTGVELGVSYNLTSTLTLEAAATHGAYIYASNPNVTKVEDSKVRIDSIDKAMVTGYSLGGMPQTAGTITLTYRSPKYWFIAVTGNVAGNAYIDMYLDRRTESMRKRTAEGNGEKLDYAMIRKLEEQEKFPWAYTLDLGGGASWRVSGGILGFNANVQNVTNNYFKTGGYEQTRVPQRDRDNKKMVPDAFPPKYYYSFGLNFFAQVYYRF